MKSSYQKVLSRTQEHSLI